MRDSLRFILLPLLFLPLMSYAQGKGMVNAQSSTVNGQDEGMVNGQFSMFNLQSSIFNLQSSMFNGTMWEQLASSPYRLDTADVRALKVELESLSFFRDNEFNSPLADGYSLPGLWVQPKLTYMPLRQIKLELGLQALIFNGANRYPNYVYHDIAYWKGNQYTKGAHLLPWFRAQADFRHLSIVLGDIYGGQNHGLIEPLFNQETNLTQDPEMGFQLLWDRPRLHADVWLNWQSYIFREDTHQEAFTVGATWRIMPGRQRSAVNGQGSKVNGQCSMVNGQCSKR